MLGTQELLHWLPPHAKQHTLVPLTRVGALQDYKNALHVEPTVATPQQQLCDVYKVTFDTCYVAETPANS